MFARWLAGGTERALVRSDNLDPFDLAATTVIR